MSFGPPTGKYVKTKRPVLRSQLDDDAEDELVSARARAIARGEGARREDSRERRLAAMTNEPNVMREVRAPREPPTAPRPRARAVVVSFVDASSRRRVRRTARSRFQIRRRPGGGQDVLPPFPRPRPTPRPLLPAQNTHPIKVDKYGNYVRPVGAPPVKSSVPPSDVRVARPRPPLDRPWSAAPSAAGTLPRRIGTHGTRRHPPSSSSAAPIVASSPSPSSLRGSERGGGRLESEVALAPEASARDVAPPPASASIARPVSASPSPVSDAPSTRKVRVPVYSVAGRRATLDELLREKINRGLALAGTRR